MQTQLLKDIDAFLAERPMPDWKFGFQAVKNADLVSRLRGGGRVWPDTEVRIRAFMLAERSKQGVAA